MMVTSNGIPGYRIEAVYGEVFASTVRPGAGSGLLRGIGGGDEAAQLRLAHDSRRHVLNELEAAAQRAGGNAVVGLRFDSTPLGNGSEVCAYGTAVRIVALEDAEAGSTPQSVAESQGQPGPATTQQSWPTMAGMGSMEFGEGERLGAATEPPAESEPRRPSAEPGPAPQPPQPHPDSPEDAPDRADDRAPEHRPRSPQQQRPNEDGSWLDL